MTAREWLNVLAILESIDEVPGMPVLIPEDPMTTARHAMFRRDPVKFLRRADEPTQAAIWAEVERRLAGGA